jgi:hypothetical protein
MTLFNAANNTRCRVETVSTNTIVGTSFGATTFSCAAGDKLVLMAPAIPEASSVNIIVNGTDDNTMNTIQFARLGVSASWVLQAVKQIAGGERLKREKMYLLWEFLADMERTMLFSDYSASYASKNTTTGGATSWTDEYPTNKGIMALAANTYSMAGTLSLEKIRKNMVLEMGDFKERHGASPFTKLLRNEESAAGWNLVNRKVVLVKALCCNSWLDLFAGSPHSLHCIFGVLNV